MNVDLAVRLTIAQVVVRARARALARSRKFAASWRGVPIRLSVGAEI
jgi:hypothetical protein